MANLKPILDSTKIALEKQASDMFGAAVEDFSRGTLGPILGVPDPATVDPKARNDGSFYASSYAAALSGGTSYRPKMKFLFKVEFVFTAEAQAAFREVLGSATSQDFTFMVKSVDRPKIDFEYEDDVNMYNFRTKVLKKIRHRELTITFMDDVGNRVLNFFRALMMIHSPITRRQLIREGLPLAQRLKAPDAKSINAGNGMLFSNPNEPTLNDNAIRGVFNSDVGNIIQTIRVKQMFVDPGSPISSAVQEVIFDFLNARLVSFDLDDLNHEVSEVNIMTMQFDYDWMEIINVGPLEAADGPHYDITVPGVNGIPIDVSPAGGMGGGAASGIGGGGGNPFANIISNQLGRAAQSITSTAINRAVQSVAGKGRFASLIGSQASNILGGVVGAASQSMASGLSNTVINAGSAMTSDLFNQASAGVGRTISGIGNSLGSSLGGSFGNFKNLILPPTQSTSGVHTVNDSALGGPAPVEAIVVTSYDHPYSDGTTIK